ncbi:class E sortase [Nocardioides sp.]|uniref:class E sortase n=1 Tax=Nocardioides sp. TaxID=35761 RepID=UPI0026312FD3|nr:class E sortase [Nocardioides sp.]
MSRATSHRRSRGGTRRLMLVAGVVLILCGLGVAGYVGWQYWGTNVVSHRHQTAAVKELRQAWHDGQAEARTDVGTANAIIEIPRFGASYAVPVFSGTSDAVLASGYGNYTSSAAPGAVGNYTLAAHRVTHGEPLRRMKELRVGDEVRVVTRTTTYVYTLTTAGSALTVPFSASWVLDPLPENPDGGVEPAQQAKQALLTLTTCAELFHTDERLVAFGVLTSTHGTP